MENLKSIVIARFKIMSLLTLSMALSMVLLMIRMKLNHSFFFLFLVWNLFLAIIPYAITIYLRSKDKHSKLSLALWFGSWLVFLPNAPYIVTDLLHLQGLDRHLIWLDALVLMSFSLNGLTLFFLSLMDMETVLSNHIQKQKQFFLSTIIMFLTGFGMYLGRFLRYNSWEIIQNPFQLFSDILDIAIHPAQHLQAWIFTLTFGSFLSVAYWLFKGLPRPNSN